jgi:hypothetical protein
LHAGFYLGAGLIMIALLAHAWLSFKEKAVKKSGT